MFEREARLLRSFEAWDSCATKRVRKGKEENNESQELHLHRRSGRGHFDTER